MNYVTRDCLFMLQVFAQSRLHNSPVLVKACILYGTCSSPKPMTDSFFFPPSTPLSSRRSIRDFVPPENSPSSPRQRRLLDASEPRAKHILQPQSAECSVFKNTLTLHTKSCALQSGLPEQSQSYRWSHQQHFHRAGCEGPSGPHKMLGFCSDKSRRFRGWKQN